VDAFLRACCDGLARTRQRRLQGAAGAAQVGSEGDQVSAPFTWGGRIGRWMGSQLPSLRAVRLVSCTGAPVTQVEHAQPRGIRRFRYLTATMRSTGVAGTSGAIMSPHPSHGIASIAVALRHACRASTAWWGREK
jgi:hypothetical protein